MTTTTHMSTRFTVELILGSWRICESGDAGRVIRYVGPRFSNGGGSERGRQEAIEWARENDIMIHNEED